MMPGSGTPCTLALLLLLLAVLAAVKVAEAKTLASKPADRRELFFLHNDRLVRMSISKQRRVEIGLAINEELADYALDELHERVFWVGRNGSVFVKSMRRKQPSQLLFAPASAPVKIDYDYYTDKLYFADQHDSVLALDLKHSNSLYHHWKLVRQGSDARIERLSVHPESGLMYVLYKHGINSSLISCDMDGSNAVLLRAQAEPIYYAVEFGSKKVEFYKRETVVDEGQEYSLFSGERDKSIREHGDEKRIGLSVEFGAEDVKQLKVYRQSVSRLRYRRAVDPCAGEDNGGCGQQAMCLLRSSPSKPACREYSQREKHHRIARQIPFDMYSQQPTLRPEPMPTQPDNSYLPVYLSIIGK